MNKERMWDWTGQEHDPEDWCIHTWWAHSYFLNLLTYPGSTEILTEPQPVQVILCLN